MLLGVDWATKHHPANRRFAKMALSKTFILLQEYIPSLDLNRMTPNRC